MALDSFDALSTRRRIFAGLVYLVPWALGFFSAFLNSLNTNAPAVSSTLALLVLPYLAFLIVVLLVLAFTTKPSRFVRFHTMQSLLLLGLVTVVVTILDIIATLQRNAELYYLNLSESVPTTSPLWSTYSDQADQFSHQMQTTSTIAFWVEIVVFIVVLVMMIAAFLGKYARLPLLSLLAEKFAGRRRGTVVQ